jgi:predicted small secreted protein
MPLLPMTILFRQDLRRFYWEIKNFLRRRGMKKILLLILLLPMLMMLAGCATVTQLGTAAKGGDIKEVEALLNKGANVNEEGIMGVTPLYEAALYNAPLEIIKLLLDKGADVNKGMRNGWRPIHMAVYNDNANLVRLLLDRGADITRRSPEGTPLQIAEKKRPYGYSQHAQRGGRKEV